MKRWNSAAALLLIICMLFCLSACSSKVDEPGTNDSDTQNIQNTQKVDPEPSGSPAAPSEPVTEAPSGADSDAEAWLWLSAPVLPLPR